MSKFPLLCIFSLNLKFSVISIYYLIRENNFEITNRYNSELLSAKALGTEMRINLIGNRGELQKEVNVALALPTLEFFSKFLEQN